MFIIRISIYVSLHFSPDKTVSILYYNR